MKIYQQNCIESLEEYNELSKKIVEVRAYLSFSNFTKNKLQEKDAQEVIPTNLKLILYMIIMVISIVGNSLLILVIFSNKFMKKSANFLILNLAICDLAILFSCMWVQTVLTKYDNSWLLGPLFCKVNSFFQMISIIASVLTLSLISCDRYIGIIYPLKSKIIAKNIVYYLAIAGVWIISFIISIPTFYYRTYTERKWSDHVEKSCDDSGWPISLIRDENGCVLKASKPFKRIYFTSVIVILFFIPFFIMTITYSIIIKKLWSNQTKRSQIVCSNKDKSIKKLKKIILMLVLLILIFFICWFPLETMLLFMEYAEAFPSWWSELEWISYFIAYSNSAINPFIYAVISENYILGLKVLKNKLLKKPKQKLRSISKDLKLSTYKSTTTVRFTQSVHKNINQNIRKSISDSELNGVNLYD